MKTKREHISTSLGPERGNILFYVLIAIVLFGALSFTLSRQSRNSGADEVDQAKVELFTTQLISYARQVQSVIDQMTITGSDIDDFDFVQPGETGFNSGSHIHKIYHPEGGGLLAANLLDGVVHEVSTVHPAAWYLGRFNHVEWTASTNTEIILTAHQISQSVCASINDKITGSQNIPILTGNIHSFLLDSGTNNDLTAAACGACEGYMSLCVSNSAQNAYSFYTVVADR